MCMLSVNPLAVLSDSEAPVVCGVEFKTKQKMFLYIYIVVMGHM